MDRMPLPPESFFEGTPPHVRVNIEQLHATIADLHTRIAELQSKLAKNATNSSLPPSTELLSTALDRTPAGGEARANPYGDEKAKRRSHDVLRKFG